MRARSEIHSVLRTIAASVGLSFLFWALLHSLLQAQVSGTASVVTSAAAMQSLSPAEARRSLPVSLSGQVVYADPDSKTWILRDSTAGVFFTTAAAVPKPQVGDEVELRGSSGIRANWAIIEAAEVRILRRSPLPAASMISMDQLVDVASDFPWVDLEASVEALNREGSRLHLVLSGARDIRAFIAGISPELPLPAEWVDAKLRLRGVWTSSFDSDGKHSANHLFVPSLDYVQVLRPRLVQSANLAVQPLEKVARFHARSGESRRVKVVGVVTAIGSASAFYIQDSSRGLRIHTRQRDFVSVGDQVEAVGFPTLDEALPQVEESVIRKLGPAPSPPPTPLDPSQVNLDSSEFEGLLVMLKGEAIGTVPGQASAELILKIGEHYISAQLRGTNALQSVSAFKPGSLLEVTGVYTFFVGHSSQSTKGGLLLRSVQDVHTLKSAPWWTVPRAVTFSSAVCTVLLLWRLAGRRKEIRIERSYRSLFENALELVSVHSSSGNFLDANPAWLHLVGATRESIRPLTLSSLVSPASQAEFAFWWQENLNSHTPGSRKFELLTATGRRAIVELRASCRRESPEEVIIELFGRDITASSRAEEFVSLENSLRSILLNAGDDLFERIFDYVKWRFESPAGLVGYIRRSDQSLVVGSTNFAGLANDHVNPGQLIVGKPDWTGPWLTILLEGEGCIKNRLEQKSMGPWRLDHFIGAPIVVDHEVIGTIQLANGTREYSAEDLKTLEHICSIVAPSLKWWLYRQEVEFRRMEVVKELQESEEHFRLVVEAAPNAMIVADQDGIIQLVNTQTEAMFKYTRQELLGQPVEQLLPVRFRKNHESMRQGFFMNLSKRPMGSGQDLFGLAKDGSEMPVEIGLSPIQAHKGQMVLASIVDLTMRKKMEEKHQRLEYQLRHSQRLEAVGTLAGGIAHDFNNILGVILGHAEFAALDVPVGHPAQPSIEEIAKAGLRAKKLVAQILSFSRKTSSSKVPVDVNSEIEDNFRLIRATFPSGVELVANRGVDVPKILADPTEIHQVLLNVCTNAWHALEGRPGRIVIDVDHLVVDEEFAARSPDLRPGSYARIAITDDGKGMDAQTLGRIFDPFFTTKDVGKGTGLGLSVVHGIMKNHNGAILVRSEPGKGSTFEFYFPAAANPDAAVEAGNIPEALQGGRGQGILYVDDELPLATVANRILKRHGYQTITCLSMAEAIKVLEDSPGEFQLVVTDYNMPGGSGLDLARTIHARWQGLPVILVSGFLTEEIRAAAFEVGVRQMLLKPVDMDELLRAVDGLVGG